MSRKSLTMLVALLLVMAVLTGCSSGGESTGSSGSTGTSESTGFQRDQNDPADALVESKCSMCHTTERIYSATKSAEEWDTTMTRMKANGMVITDEEYDQILGYLSK